MNLRATLGVLTVAASALIVAPAASQADHHHRIDKHLHDIGSRLASLCPLSWWRHRHAEPAAKKVVYAKKVAAKKAAPAPLK